MKWLSACLVFFFVLSLEVDAAGDRSGRDTIDIRLIVDETYPYGAQWVYLFCIEPDSNMYLCDSCQMEPGSYEYVLTARPHYVKPGNPYFFELFFSKYPPRRAAFDCSLDEAVCVHLSAPTSHGYVRVTGSYEAELAAWYRSSAMLYRHRIETLRDSLSRARLDNREMQALRDSIDDYEYKIGRELQVEYFSRTKIPSRCLGILRALTEYWSAPGSLTDSLSKAMKERFPDNEAVRLYPERYDPPISNASRRTSMRRMSILHESQKNGFR